MTTKIKKLFNRVTNGRFFVLLDVRLVNIYKWSYVIVFDMTTGEYIVGWNTIKQFNINDLLRFNTFDEAIKYIKSVFFIF